MYALLWLPYIYFGKGGDHFGPARFLYRKSAGQKTGSSSATSDRISHTSRCDVKLCLVLASTAHFSDPLLTFALLAVWLFCSGGRSEPGISGDGLPWRRRSRAHAHQAHAYQLQAPPAAHDARLLPHEPQSRRQGPQAAQPEDRPAEESFTGTVTS